MTQINSGRRRFLGATAAVGATALTGNLGSIALAKEGRVLNTRSSSVEGVFDPGYMNGPEIRVLDCVLPRLAVFEINDGTLGWSPSGYVRHLTQVDDTHIDFALKPGFQWTNGFGELTAEDVKYSYERMLVADNGASWSALDRVDVKDRYSGTIVLKHPFAPFWTTTMIGDYAVIVCRNAVEAVGGRYTTEIPATCGPYLVEIQEKRQAIFTLNPDWTGEEPFFDTVNYFAIPEDKAGELAYEAGEIDFTNITDNTILRYQQDPPPNTKINIPGALRYMWMGMNTEHPKLRDIRVRRAIQHAVDAESVRQFAFPVADRAYGMIPPGLIGKRNEVKYDYDPDRSRALLNEAGVVGLELDLKTRNEFERVQACQVIQANLAEVGIQVNVIPLDRGQMSKLGREQKGDDWQDSQLFLRRFRAEPDPFDPAQWFVRDQVGNWNWERWSDDEYEDLYQRGLVESDLAKRHQIYIRMQEIMEETGGYVWICHQKRAVAHRDYFEPKIAPSGVESYRRFREA